METRRFYQDTAEKGGFAFTGLLIGAAAGGLAALLLAPQSGRKTRHLITEKATDIKDMAMNATDTARSQMNQVVNKAQQMSSSSSGQNFTDKLRNQAQDVADKARKEAKQVMKSAKKKDQQMMENMNMDMDNDSDFNIGSMLLGMLVGAALGAGTALLTAPQSGEHTRHIIEDKAGQLKDQANQLKDQAMSATENVRHQAKNAYETAKDKAQSTVQSAKQNVGQSPSNRELKEEVDILENTRNREFPL